MLKSIKFDFNKLAGSSLTYIGEVSTKQAKANMAKTSHGRTYIIGGKKHIASKRGDAPNNLSGDLSDSIRFSVGVKTMKFGMGNSKINYAKHLEGPLFRPNIVKSVLENKEDIEKKLTRLFKASLRFSQ